MLRDLIAWVLNNYLGKYVENLNTTQLTVALLSGEVELENLPLKKDALSHFGLPIKAYSGSIGKIKLQVPVRQFRSAPWCINIEKVYIICGPVNLEEWDNNAEEQADLHYKQALLDNLEAKWRTQHEDNSYYASSYTGWMNYGTSLITNIVENLQLNIKDVHIRYEDTITIPDRHFCCGLTIESLTAQSCDSNWAPGFTANWAQNQATFKLVELNSFSLYVDPLEPDEIFSKLDSSELNDAIEKLKAKLNHEFIIKPVSAQAKLKRDRSETPLRTRNRPRLTCDLQWNEVSLSLNEYQYETLVNGLRGLDDVAKFKKYRLLQPKEPIKENPRKWWRYAARCHGFFRHQDPTIIAKNNLRYLSICKRLIANPNEMLNSEDKDFKESFEKERSLDDLRELREICMMLLPQPNEIKPDGNIQGRSMLLHWFPQWWGWYGNEASSDTTETPSHPPNLESQSSFEDEFLNALNDTVETNSILKRDAVFGKFHFILKKGTLDVFKGGFGTDLMQMIQFQFENLLLNVESRPRSGSHFVSLSLGSILLKDHLTLNTEFPDIIKPQIKDEVQQKTKLHRSRLSLSLTPISPAPEENPEPLMQLEYERKPFNCNTDYRLLMKSRSLDIVYNIDVIKWIMDFLSKPHQQGARKKLEAMKHKTKMELKKNWDHITEGRLSERKTWTLEIDVSAPQIIFAENFSDRQGSSIVVVDFGRLQITNGTQSEIKDSDKTMNNESTNVASDMSMKDSEDDEMFMTPCSTPPGSEEDESPTLNTISDSFQTPLTSNVYQKQIPVATEELELNESNLYKKIYDRYNINLTDLQILVCKGKERWNYASSKGTSNLHVLDRFNISLQLERRIVHTNDPQYPSLTLCGTLPKLNVHINESKIGSIINMINVICNNNIESPFRSPTDIPTDAEVIEEIKNEDSPPEASKLILLQFSIDQMSLEVQSCGRSIAELQVTGVKAGYTQRASDTNITLSVHGLLLVDAMQSYGPDFELLVASHRHVGMDSLSGSLRQSEPCSPCSPASPDPSHYVRPTSPLSISRAISSLQRVNSPPHWNAPLDDVDALITIEILLIEPEGDGERLHVATIQFNNLDIIANQETIVELIGFAKRVLPKKSSKSNVAKNLFEDKNVQSSKKKEQKIRTEITFDFHRLNVLILRAVMRDNFLVARKVGTFTMSEARIHATVGKTVTVEGSLGGLQVLDLTPEGINHQRILSVGNDPLTDPPTEPVDLITSLSNEVYGIKLKDVEERQALSFRITRNLNACVEVKIRMGSVWFLHCARFMQELNWCATEFKHYLKNLARSIRVKATDMAMGLVQPRPGDITTGRSVPDFTNSPRHSRRHRTVSLSKIQENLLAPSAKVRILLDVVLKTPVLVVPRSSSSPQVLVAHLGRISISNCKENAKFDLLNDTITSMNEDNLHLNFNAKDFQSEENIFEIEDVDETTVKGSVGSVNEDDCHCDIYSIDIRNMNLYSLDTTSRKGFRLSALPRAEEFYSCQNDAIAIVHDTAIRLEICRKMEASSHNFESSSTSFASVTDGNVEDKLDQLIVSGSIINPLRLSFKRQQYEQLIDTIENAFKVPTDLIRPPTETNSKFPTIDEQNETDLSDNFTFDNNQTMKKVLFSQASLERKNQPEMLPKVMFSLPVFIIQLNNNENAPVVEICLRDFNVNYEKQNLWETNLQVSLRSVIMEDLLRPIDSKHRIMVSSANEEQQRLPTPFLSNSCPNLTVLGHGRSQLSTSLPDNLEPNVGFQQFVQRQKFLKFGLLNLNTNPCPGTPPPSPQTRSREDNLVIYSSFIVDPNCPQFESKYKSRKARSSIDFNCLSLNVSVESWFVLLNFLGLVDDNEPSASKTTTSNKEEEVDATQGTSELDISVKSLTLVLVKPDYELAKANVSNARFIVTAIGPGKTIEGSLGSISLNDLTSHGAIYREKFMTSGNEALNFIYTRDAAKPAAGKRSLKKDAQLNIKMSSVRYVHTKRFVMEIQTFVKDLFKLQVPVMKKMKPTDTRQMEQHRPTQLGLEIYAESPLILLPLSSRSEKLIVANLGEFSLQNEFKMSNDRETISVRHEKYGPIEMLDVMLVHLLHTDLFAGYRVQKPEGSRLESLNESADCLDMGTYLLYKCGPSLLKDKCHLKLQIERNLDSWRSHNVDDISVHGTLSKLEAELDLQQYKLIRGFLTFNMGEEIDDVYESSVLTNIYDSNISLNTSQAANEPENVTWNNLSISLDLQNVSVSLKQKSEAGPLVCVNFIKSTLKVDSKSDGSQDIDLISQEILITDTRSWGRANEINPVVNVFTNILKPMNDHGAIIQLEIHSRRRQDNTQFTILLTNMRLMMIIDWLELARDFILQNEDQPLEVSVTNKKENSVSNAGTFELKLNITDSELVLVESTDRLDSNAVILKSTTVLNYRPHESNKTMSINLNNLEVFSCALNAEEETALSIIDPVTINMEVRQGTLGIHLQKQLLIRLSYHDVKMFQRMLQSLPQQTRQARNRRSGSSVQIDEGKNLLKLRALGFKNEDCKLALEVSDNQLDEAALWLTQNAEPLKSPMHHQRFIDESPMNVNTVELKANRISICVIDDCKDADVPLLELALTHLELSQDVNFKDRSPMTGNIREGHLKAVLASDYFNRALSGWEPIVEPWKGEANWSYCVAQLPTQNSRLNLKVKSSEVLRVNMTSTLMEIYQTVRDNWTQDYYSSSAVPSIVRRSPFVPFAIKNETGMKLHFTTFVAAPGTSFGSSDIISKAAKEWRPVHPGEVVSFTFAQTQTKHRHIDSHKLNLHQIAVRISGWAEVGPVSVDKVGVFFRHAGPEIVDNYSALPRARIVFAVTLEGSAQKLITIRSALKFVNKLDHPVLMKMEHLFGHLNIRSWPPPKTVIVSANEIYSVPLSHVHSFLYVKPLPINFRLEEISADSSVASSTSSSQIEKIDGNEYWNRFGKFCDGGSLGNFQFTEKSIHWKETVDPQEINQEMRTCCSISNKIYKLVFAIKKENYPSKDNVLLPGHSITLWPPLRLHNLLPCDLLFKLPTGSQGRISPANTANIHEVDLELALEVTITLDSFSGAGLISIHPGFTGVGEVGVKLTDVNGRVLLLQALIQVIRGNGMQISISAPFWLVNRTGLPLVFKQEGVGNDFAGQFSENEQGRLVSPLMFSFSDPESSMALTIRLGKRYGSNLPWCQPFNLHKDIFHRQLKSNSTNETFVLGIEVRSGRGRYSQTSIVTFSPRFQLYNRSSYKLQFAQKCFATILTDPTSQSTFIEAIPGCHLPFHWPRLDKDQQLCVRLPELEDCLWSSGIPIHETQSLYVNVRDINGNMRFLRLEIILQGATYYMLFGNAEVLPPPIRIDNYSEVSIKFYQNDSRNQIKTTVKPHSSMAYVLDEINGSQSICLEAPGGDTCKCPLYGFDSGRLTYENFIYIGFTQTFENVSNYSADFDEYDVKAQQLVLGVVGNRVILVKKQAGDRSQLWRMNNEKQLEHEGSSPPSEPGKKAQRFVLDLEKPPQPKQHIQLVVRPANHQRRSTQTWYFTEDGRLMCEHTSMCVQPRNGFFGLRNGTDAVLGLIVRDTKIINSVGVPFEQAIERQKLRPGSGCLSLNFRMDGPIKTLQIKDVKLQTDHSLSVDPCWRHVSHILPNSGNYQTENADAKKDSSIDEYHVNLSLVKGLGLSLVSRRPCEELAYISFEDIHTEIINTPLIKSLDLSVRDVQIDNQLFETTCPIFLCTIKSSSDEIVEERLPALQLNVKVLSSPNRNAVIFEHLILSLRPLSVFLEERLLLRLADFFGMGKSVTDPATLPDESDYEAQRIVTKVLAANAKRYYFGDLSIVPSQIRLSSITASKIPPHLADIKKSLGLTLIKFEDAVVNFDKFCDRHHFETLELYWSAIKSHYKQELKWQAASILGSVDFLGNPLGFANDLSEGVSSLLKEGNVKSLVKNVTHGISNSTAKLTETLSDGLGRVVFDDQHSETRQRILEVSTALGGNSTGDHLVAGLKGFGFGLLGGVTSIVKHTYNGAQADGFPGFMTGLGRGIVGTVTKPVIGVLDLASETANAVRETSKSSSRILPDRKRSPRCVTGAPGGLLPPYSSMNSKGQQHLFLLNKRDFTEKFMAYEPCLLETKDSKLRLLVSTEKIWVFSKSEETPMVIFTYDLSELITCKHVEVFVDGSSSSLSHSKNKKSHYIELCLSLPSKTSLTPSAPEMVKRPRVKCQNEEIAKKAERNVNYAKSVYEEREHALNDSVI